MNKLRARFGQHRAHFGAIFLSMFTAFIIGGFLITWLYIITSF